MLLLLRAMFRLLLLSARRCYHIAGAPLLTMPFFAAACRHADIITPLFAVMP